MLFVGLFAVGVDRLLRWMFNRASVESGRYPHRIATELPRALHKADHDEVIELKDETELAAK